MKLHAAEQDAEDAEDGVETEHEDPDAVENDTDAEEEGAEDPDGSTELEDQSAQPVKRTAIEERAETERLARERGQLEGERAANQRAENERRRADEERQEREAMGAMTEEQRTQYLLAKEVRATKNENGATRLLVQSSTDQNKFTRTLTRKPQYAKFEDEVERRHQATLAQGGFISRDVILAHMIGEKALQAENVTKQKAAGQRRIQEQRGGKGARGARGDRSGGERGAKSLTQRAEEQDWAI